MKAVSVSDMSPNEVRDIYLDFFKARGHAIIPSASLIPENDPTVLFTTAGMHPLVPFLLGEPHPEGKRLADVQKCIRTGDIEEVGDFSHLTFFEMLGNWSLGDYFKEDTIAWSYELLTGKEGFGLDPERLFVTVFEGDDDAPRDDVSIGLWQEQFRKAGIDAKVDVRIFLYPKSENWWGPAGQTGPCGPDSEMFYDLIGDGKPTEHAPGWTEGGTCHPNCPCGRFVEIWNDVFMEYFKTAEGTFEPLEQKNVDTGMGFERMVMIRENVKTVFDSSLFASILGEIESLSGKSYTDSDEVSRAMRIIADHIRTAVFILGDPHAVAPSNVDQGYVLRRIIRRAVRMGKQIGIVDAFTVKIAEHVIRDYKEAYPELETNRKRIMDELAGEEEKFSATLERGLKEVMKVAERHADADRIPADEAFTLYESYGFPKELTEEVTGKRVDEAGWVAAMKRHQELSRKGAEKRFAGGLADDSEEVVRLHTATHLLHMALRTVLGDHVEQRGSNITKERLRFDFSHGEKMTPEQKDEVQRLVNEQIEKDLPVRFETMGVDEAKSQGVIGLFEDKYAALGNKVKVYFVGDEEHGYFSKEICGGPHVAHTGMLGNFRIKKEETSSAGVRRIKATVTGND